MNYLPDLNTAIHIGDLHFNVTEKILFDKFMKFGEIVLVKVARDNITKKSLGHGFVTFKKRNEAEKAIIEMNLCYIYGQACRVDWYEKDKSKRQFGPVNIVISHLNKMTSAREIYDTFGQFGKICSCKLKADQSFVCTNQAIVNYQEEISAKTAAEVMNNKEFQGNIVTVMRIPTTESCLKERLVDCYIDNLSVSFDDAVLKFIFEKYGSVVMAKIMLKDDGTSKGFGFVTFSKSEDAARAIIELDGTKLKGRKVHVYQILQKKKGKVSGCNLYINNMSESMTDERLEELFRGFGDIVSARVMVKPGTNTPIGYGFVAFSNKEDGDKAIREMNGRVVDGKTLYVALKSTEPVDTPRQNYLMKSSASSSGDSQSDYSSFVSHTVQPLPDLSNASSLSCSFPSQNSVRMPVPQSVSVPRSACSESNEKKRIKDMLGEKLYPIVNKYHNDEAGSVTSRLLECSTGEIFEMLDDESVLKRRVQEIVAAINDELQVKIRESKRLRTQGRQSDDGSDGWSSVSGALEDTEEDLKVKRSLCCKIYSTVSSIASDCSAKEVVKAFMKLSKTELLYMLEHEEYLRSKVEVVKNELKVLRCTSKCEAEKSGMADLPSNHGSMVDMGGDRRSLCNRMYSLVSKYAANNAGYVTDVFMGLDEAELQYMVDNEEYLRMKVQMILGYGNGAPHSSRHQNGTKTRTTTNDTLTDDTLVSEVQEALKFINVPKYKTRSIFAGSRVVAAPGGLRP